MNKKIFAVCAMLIMCICVFAACNNKENGEVTSTEPATTTIKASETTDLGEDLGDRLSSAVSEVVTDVSEMMPTAPTTNIAS